MMNDPPRLFHQCTLEGALLRAARREPTPARAHERMLKTLGIAASTLTASAAKAAVVATVVNAKPAMAAFGSAAITKLAVIGSVGALLTVGVAREVQRRSHISNTPTPPSMSAPRNAKINHASRGLIDSGVAAASPEASTKVALLPPRKERTHAGAHRSAVPDLAAEVSTLDQARAACAAGDFGRTLALLDVYQRQFPNGSLVPEAQLLSIEALVHQGQRMRALALARRLLDAAPDGPLSERVRSLLPELE